MRALWKLCLVVVVAVGGLAGQVVMPKDIMCDMKLEEDSYGLDWRPDTAGYPITLSTNLINSEGEAWRTIGTGYYRIIRSDGSFTTFDKNGVFIRSGTWFTIENYQITDHPYQAGPATVNIIYYNFQRDDGKMGIRRAYYTSNLRNFSSNIGAVPIDCYYRTNAPTK